jgi:hypothetical protein
VKDDRASVKCVCEAFRGVLIKGIEEEQRSLGDVGNGCEWERHN